MKTFVAAIALTIASPAFAQAAPAQPDQGHAQHRQQQGEAGHAQHPQGQHQPGPHGQNHGQHQQGQHRACCADRDGDGRMDCREEGEARPAGHDSH